MLFYIRWCPSPSAPPFQNSRSAHRHGWFSQIFARLNKAWMILPRLPKWPQGQMQRTRRLNLAWTSWGIHSTLLPSTAEEVSPESLFHLFPQQHLPIAEDVEICSMQQRAGLEAAVPGDKRLPIPALGPMLFLENRSSLLPASALDISRGAASTYC